MQKKQKRFISVRGNHEMGPQQVLFTINHDNECDDGCEGKKILLISASVKRSMTASDAQPHS